MKRQKLFKKLLTKPNNTNFTEVVNCAQMFGFKLDRKSGSHHIFVHDSIQEILNLQEVKGKAKPYQIKQLLKIIEKYNLQIEE